MKNSRDRSDVEILEKSGSPRTCIKCTFGPFSIRFVVLKLLHNDKNKVEYRFCEHATPSLLLTPRNFRDKFRYFWDCLERCSKLDRIQAPWSLQNAGVVFTHETSEIETLRAVRDLLIRSGQILSGHVPIVFILPYTGSILHRNFEVMSFDSKHGLLHANQILRSETVHNPLFEQTKLSGHVPRVSKIPYSVSYWSQWGTISPEECIQFTMVRSSVSTHHHGPDPAE